MTAADLARAETVLLELYGAPDQRARFNQPSMCVRADQAMQALLDTPSKPEDMMVHLLIMVVRSLARIEDRLESK